MLSNAILKNFLTYSSGAIILRIISALISFYSLKFLTTSEYGILALINTFIGIVPIFFSLGLRQAFWLEFFHKDHHERKQVINDIIAIYFLISLPIFIISLISVKWINKIIFINQTNSIIIYTCLLICFLHFFTELFFQVFRYQEKPKILIKIQILMALVNIFSAFILMYFLNFKIEGIIFANLISSLLVCFFGLYFYIKKIGFFKFNILKNKNKICYYLKLGFPFIPSIIFSWVLSFADRWLLAYYQSFSQVGLYSLADSFAQMFQAIILIPLINSYQPNMLKKFNFEKNKILEFDKQNLKIMIFICVLLITITTGGFLIFKNIFYWILPFKYHEAINYILILLYGQIFFLGSQFASCFLIHLKKSYILMWIMIFSACLNIYLNYLFILKYSLYGCSFATTFSYFIYLVLIIFANFYYKKKMN